MLWGGRSCAGSLQRERALGSARSLAYSSSSGMKSALPVSVSRRSSSWRMHAGISTWQANQHAASTMGACLWREGHASHVIL